MMQGFLSDAVALDWVTDLVTRCRFASLHFELPSWTDPTASEISDAGYARQPCTWEIISNRTIGNLAVLSFTTSLSTAAVALGFHDELTASTMTCYSTTPAGTPLATSLGGTIVLGRGSVVLGFG
jgi:hypothetical protein